MTTGEFHALWQAQSSYCQQGLVIDGSTPCFSPNPVIGLPIWNSPCCQSYLVTDYLGCANNIISITEHIIHILEQFDCLSALQISPIAITVTMVQVGHVLWNRSSAGPGCAPQAITSYIGMAKVIPTSESADNFNGSVKGEMHCARNSTPLLAA